MNWPLLKFWTYTPLGWCAAVLWNCCEFLHVRVPFAPHVFGLIIGSKPVRGSSPTQTNAEGGKADGG
jgi:hypothetical protein